MLINSQIFYYYVAHGMPHHHVVGLEIVILVTKVKVFLIS
jgi:hypothetical protein